MYWTPLEEILVRPVHCTLRDCSEQYTALWETAVSSTLHLERQQWAVHCTLRDSSEQYTAPWETAVSSTLHLERQQWAVHCTLRDCSEPALWETAVSLHLERQQWAVHCTLRDCGKPLQDMPVLASALEVEKNNSLPCTRGVYLSGGSSVHCHRTLQQCR